jgi:hypothetical protein
MQRPSAWCGLEKAGFGVVGWGRVAVVRAKQGRRRLLDGLRDGRQTYSLPLVCVYREQQLGWEQSEAKSADSVQRSLPRPAASTKLLRDAQLGRSRPLCGCNAGGATTIRTQRKHLNNRLSKISVQRRPRIRICTGAARQVVHSRIGGLGCASSQQESARVERRKSLWL